MTDQIEFLNDYQPNFWLKNSHLMTITASLLPRSLKDCSSESLLIPVDKKSILLARTHIKQDVKRCLVIVHGLEGSSESPYVTGLATKALAADFNVVRINLRNCGNTLHLTPTLYNAGQSDDLCKVIDWLTEKKGQTEQYIIGFSLGGNLVLKTLAEIGDHQFVRGGCVVSPSIDLAASVDRLAKGFNRLYAQNFLCKLRRKIVIKNRFFPKLYDINLLKKVNDIRDFDNLFTAPNAGYTDAAHYYREASAKDLIDQIKINTLIITAQDDPIIPFEAFAKIDHRSIQLLAPKHGGHVSFLSNNSSGNKNNLFWSDNQIIAFCLRQSQLYGEISCLN
jgi:predicted alpha/beta-fold hydrolase